MTNPRTVLIVVIALIVAVLIYREMSRRKAARPETGGAGPVLQVRPIPVSHNLALGSFSVPAKGSHVVTIKLDEEGLRNARLTGRFSVTNGAAIQVMLLDESQYKNFQSGSTPAGFLYLSKNAANGNIQAMFPGNGTYYLVFDNSSSSSPVDVNSDVTYRYETIHVDSGAHP